VNTNANSLVMASRTMMLPEILDVVAAGSLAESLLSLRGAYLEIDGSRVQRLGGQCLQILLSALSTWKADEAILEFTHLSFEFVENLALFGVSSALFTQQELAQ